MAIFISLAAYRDPQLGPTIADCLTKARYPEQLRFGVCWQHGEDEEPLPYWSDDRFRVLDVDWRQSKGACWARAEIMKLWQGEEYFLQLDSHHRFVQDWDVKLLEQLERTGSARPILTAYASPFTPGDPDTFDADALQMNFDRFTDEAIVLFRPGAIPSWQTLDRPVRARFLSAHFLFTIGEFVRDVPYDPDLYFIGEEITLALRAYTHGYDLFHPSEIIVWHEYTRSYRTKHWDDHVSDNGVERAWYDRDSDSKEKVKRFLADPWVGPFGCGTVRSVGDYEAYAGLSFKYRRAHEYTKQGKEPPNPPVPDDWASRLRNYQVEIVVDRASLPAAALADPQFWYVGFHDATGQEVYRLDAGADEVATITADGATDIRLQREFETDREPATWMVWPCSQSEGWLRKIEGTVHATSAPVTLVTALLDIGRGKMTGPFSRSFDTDDLPLFERLLAINLPMVIYLDPKHADIVWRHRKPHNTRIVPTRPEDLRAAACYEPVQAIRSNPSWLQQAGWLPHSPQAALEYYNPLVMSKLRWLGEQAQARPFATERVFWIDAGLCRTVREHLLCDPRLADRLVDTTDRFLCIAFPYAGQPEIHGFPREPLTRLAGAASVERVVRGGFFGGDVQSVLQVADLYAELLGSTLADGYMGTEESVFTILSYRHPDLFQCFMVSETGLVGRFFESLVEGEAEQLLLKAPTPPEDATSPAVDAPVSGPADDASPPVPATPARVAPHGERDWPPGIISDDPEVAQVGYSTFLGLQMLQNRNAIFAFEALTRHLQTEGIRVARIIEIGTSYGGLAVFLQIYCLASGADFVTYETHANAADMEVFKRLQIDQRLGDVSHEFLINEIGEEIQKPGTTLILCDGPKKARDVNTFSDFLKRGDLILAHDYGPSHAVFDAQIRGRLWSWCEITDADIQQAIDRNTLVPVLPNVLQPAVWGGWTKHGDTVRQARPTGSRIYSVGLYVLTFNAPEQFALWLGSVETAAPELLTCKTRVLLNNSTDEATFAAYDELCSRYGFEQYRPGNIGINGGRVWCARHFEEESSADAMLYFEDDMLLHTEDGVCSNGFSNRVPDLLEHATAIVQNEDLDFLKLSYSELHGDHSQNWAYVNLPEDERGEYFPYGSATRVEAIKSYRGTSYLLGDIFYSNWPMLITRRGSRTMFLNDLDVPLFEQFLMVRALKLTRAGALRGGVLLASPVNHQRVVHYGADERKEC